MARRKAINYNIIFGAAMMLIIIASVWGYLVVLEQSQTENRDSPQGTDPIAHDLLAYSGEGLSGEEISELLGGNYKLLVNGQDINADGAVEFIVSRSGETSPSLHPKLQEDGYALAIERLIIYRNTNGSMVPILTLDPEGIRDEDGAMLIDQVRAGHGYAAQIYDYENLAVYPAPVKIIDIALLDEHGQADSDDITVYWDPKLKRYRATNTFGAPGTFSQ